MDLPKPSHKLLVTLFIIFVLVAAASAGYLLFLKPKDTAKPVVVSAPKEEEPEPLSTEILEAEKLAQFDEKSAKYDLNQIDGTPDKTIFPDIESPNFLSIKNETKITDSETVASFHIGSDFRAYPMQYISFHHIVNDKFGDKRVLISFCALCNSAAAFDPQIGGQKLTFGVLGILLHNDMIMYDKETDSWWIQVTGEAINGKYKGKRLTILPGMELVQYSEFKKAHPDGKVLQPVSGHSNSYQQFGSEFGQQKPQSEAGSIADFDQVLGIEVRKKHKGYKVADIKSKKVLNEKLNGWSLLLVADPNDGGVRIFRRFIEPSNRIPMVLDFELKDGKLVDKQTKSTWNFQGKAVEGELKGETLAKPVYLELFYQAWENFYPKTTIYNPKKT